MALTTKGVEEFENLLHLFYDASINKIQTGKEFVTIQYELNSKVATLITTPHCLLAAITIAQQQFKSPVENPSDLDTSHKTLY